MVYKVGDKVVQVSKSCRKLEKHERKTLKVDHIGHSDVQLSNGLYWSKKYMNKHFVVKVNKNLIGGKLI